MCSGVLIGSAPSYIYGEVWTRSQTIANKSHVIRWITTHEIRIIPELTRSREHGLSRPQQGRNVHGFWCSTAALSICLVACTSTTRLCICIDQTSVCVWLLIPDRRYLYLWVQSKPNQITLPASWRHSIGAYPMSQVRPSQALDIHGTNQTPDGIRLFTNNSTQNCERLPHQIINNAARTIMPQANFMVSNEEQNRYCYQRFGLE